MKRAVSEVHLQNEDDLISFPHSRACWDSTRPTPAPGHHSLHKYSWRDFTARSVSTAIRRCNSCFKTWSCDFLKMNNKIDELVYNSDQTQHPRISRLLIANLQGQTKPEISAGGLTQCLCCETAQGHLKAQRDRGVISYSPELLFIMSVNLHGCRLNGWPPFLFRRQKTLHIPSLAKA